MHDDADIETKEFEVVSLHPGVTREQVRENTGWDVRFADASPKRRRPTATSWRRCEI